MAVRKRRRHLLAKIPKARGRLSADVDLAKLTWFRVGGPAEVLFRPADEIDLMEFLKKLPKEVPVTILGVGSNTLVRDGGIPGVSIRLGAGFNNVTVTNQTVIAGAGIPNLKLSNVARDKSLTGMEFLSGIPGGLGGSIRMNAGAFDGEVKDLVENVRAITRSGERVSLSLEQLNFGYRQTDVAQELVFVEARLRGVIDDQDSIIKKMSKIQAERKISQPVKQPTGGSTFINPPGEAAWELIDRAGCRGLVRGEAQVSIKHCNFLINLGGATAADFEGLGEEVRRRVFDVTGTKLEWEIIRVGIHENGDFGEVGL